MYEYIYSAIESITLGQAPDTVVSFWTVGVMLFVVLWSLRFVIGRAKEIIRGGNFS